MRQSSARLLVVLALIDSPGGFIWYGRSGAVLKADPLAGCWYRGCRAD
jgi:hypothetical protein